MPIQSVNPYPQSTKRVFTDHGFDAFINCDDSVSFYLPSMGEYGLDYDLITVTSKDDAKVAIGY